MFSPENEDGMAQITRRSAPCAASIVLALISRLETERTADTHPLPRFTMSPIQFLRTLTKSKSDVWLGSVCGGLGFHTTLPSWVWRILFPRPAFFPRDRRNLPRLIGSACPTSGRANPVNYHENATPSPSRESSVLIDVHRMPRCVQESARVSHSGIHRACRTGPEFR